MGNLDAELSLAPGVSHLGTALKHATRRPAAGGVDVFVSSQSFAGFITSMHSAATNVGGKNPSETRTREETTCVHPRQDTRPSHIAQASMATNPPI